MNPFETLMEQGQILSFLESCVENACGRELPDIKQIEINPQEDSIAYMLGDLEKTLNSI